MLCTIDKLDRLWIAAKASAETNAWLPLDWHLKDTACVMEYLTENWLPEGVFRELRIKKDECKKAVKFLALVHDIGKATPAFQKKISEELPNIRKRLADTGYELPVGLLDRDALSHAHMGEVILMQAGVNEWLTVIAGAHHGKTDDDIHCVHLEEHLMEYHQHFGYHEQPWEELQEALLAWALQKAGYESVADLPMVIEPAQMLLTGLLVMADWIASNETYFPLIPVDGDIPEYDPLRAERAMEALNLPKPITMADDWREPDFFRTRFGCEPDAAQKAMYRLAASVCEPGVMIMEAPEGRTEGALAAAEVLMNRFGLGGVAYFLPHQSAANAMFDKILLWLKNCPEMENVAVQLAHGSAALNPEFTRLAGNPDAGSEDSVFVHDFFQGKETKLLSNVVVGTIDQLLMASLTHRHVMLRHLGLAGKVVIIDDCNACDAFMSVYLDSILSWLGAYNIPVILLSQILPGIRREELLMAYNASSNRGKIFCGRSVLATRAYPLISYSELEEISLYPVVTNGQDREVEIKKVLEKDIYKEIWSALDEGGCIGILLNTVYRTQELAKRVMDKFPDAVVLVDHSQLITADRLEREAEIRARAGMFSTEGQREKVIVIGSPALDQPLDFDLLVTDLCPMELLMKRMTMVHRYPRKRPDLPAQCLVMDCGTSEAGAEAIYGRYPLLRTEALLPDKILIPGDIPNLVQETYDEEKGLAVYPDEYREYRLMQKRMRKQAEPYCLRKPSTRRGYTISDLLVYGRGMSEETAMNSVRGGTSTIEVIPVRHRGLASAEVLAGPDKGTLIRLDREPAPEEAQILATQKLRLPHPFNRDSCISQVIGELETLTEENVPDWIPVLGGIPVLVLDEDRRGVLHKIPLRYDKKLGLIYEKEEVNGNRKGI